MPTVTPSDPANLQPRGWPRSVLAWPAWLRVLAVVPPLVVLWLAVAWASRSAPPL